MPPRSKQTDPAELSDAELAAETEKAALDAGTAVKLQTVYPADVFNPSIEGVDPITRDGTLVPAEHEEAIRKLARKYGVRIQKASN